MANQRKQLCQLLPDEVRAAIRSGTIIPGAVKFVEELHISPVDAHVVLQHFTMAQLTEIYNAIDASASNIIVSVNLENWRVKVEDDGDGLGKEDLSAIGIRYYTSKIQCYSDLSALRQYGFRGEALASIIDNASTVEIRTKRRGKSAYMKKFKNGMNTAGVIKVHDSKFPKPGFIIYVDDFFHKTPVRKKRFDRAIEMEELKVCVETIGLINHTVTITLRDDTSGAKIAQTKSYLSPLDAFEHFIKRKQGVLQHNDIISERIAVGRFLILGTVSRTSHYSRNLQFLYVNRRYVTKSRLYKLIQEHLSPVLGFGNRYSTSSSKGSEENFKRSSQKAQQASERYPVFLFNITCSFHDYNLSMDGNKNKVEFLNLDDLTKALKEFFAQFNHNLTSLRAAKVAQNRGVAAALARKQPGQSTCTDGVRIKDEHSARKIAKQLGIHDLKRAVQSKPAVRPRMDDMNRMSYEEPKKKPRLRSLLMQTGSDKDSTGSAPDSDHSKSSDEDASSAESQNNVFRPKKNLIARKNPKISHKLQRIHTHDIRSLKRRHLERQSIAAQGTSRRISDYFESKKPRLAKDITSRVEAAEGKAPSSPPNYSPHSAFREESKAESGNESDVSRRFSVLSVSENMTPGCSFPKSDPRKQTVLPAGSAVDVHEEIRASVEDFSRVNTIPDYVTISKQEILNRIAAHPSGNELLQNILQDVANRRVVAPPVTPANAILKYQITPNYYSQSKDTRDGGKNYQSSQLVSANCMGKQTTIPVVIPAATPEHTLQNLQEDTRTGENCRQYSNTGNIRAADGEYSCVTFRKKSKGSKSSGQDEAAKRYGRYFDSQEDDIFKLQPSSSVLPSAAPVVHNPFCYQTSHVSRKKPDFNTTSLSYIKDRVENWVTAIPVGEASSIMSRDADSELDHMEFRPNRPKSMEVDSIGGPMIFRRSRQSSSSTDEPRTQTQWPVSYSQQYKDGGRNDHVRLNLGLPNIFSEELQEENEEEEEAEGTLEGLFGRADDDIPMADSNLFGIVPGLNSSLPFCLNDNRNNDYLAAERPRQTTINPTTEEILTDSPVKKGRMRSLSTEDIDSKYFAPNFEQNRSSIDPNNGKVITNSDLSKFFNSKPVPENSLLNDQQSEAKTSIESNYESNRRPEDVLCDYTSRSFRSTWLKKVFPEGANKFYDPAKDAKREKTQRVGNLDLLNNPKTKIGSLVSSCFLEAEEDLVNGKWRNNDELESSRCFDHQSCPVDLPLMSLNSQEINFWNKRMDDHPVACRFTKEQLAKTTVIGQVDRKFIAAKVEFNHEDGGSSEKLLLFDQHAVHERIRLEKLIADSVEETFCGDKAIVCTEVKPPMQIIVTDTAVRIIEKYRHEFALLGTTVEVTGSSSVTLSTAPKCFAERVAKEARATRDQTMEQLLEALLQEKVQNIIQTNGATGTMPKTILNVLKSQACKGAIKFGDALSHEACVELLADLKYCKAPFQCAHGRPVLVPLVDL